MKYFRHIPNLLTLCNLALGCAAVALMTFDRIEVVAVRDSVTGRFPLEQIGPGQMQMAGLLVMFAAVFDFLDGLAARLFRAQTEFGKQLDSLADIVSFGLVPALIMYHLLAITSIGPESAHGHRFWHFAPAFFITIAAAIKLARYNSSGEEAVRFLGLPVPATALIIASLPIIMFRHEAPTYEFLLNPWVLIGIIAVLGGLTIGKWRVMSLRFDVDPKNNALRLAWILSTIAVSAALVMLFNSWATIVPAGVLLLILFSLLSKRSPT